MQEYYCSNHKTHLFFLSFPPFLLPLSSFFFAPSLFLLPAKSEEHTHSHERTDQYQAAIAAALPGKFAKRVFSRAYFSKLHLVTEDISQSLKRKRADLEFSLRLCQFSLRFTKLPLQVLLLVVGLF